MNRRLLFLIPALPDFVPYVYNYFRIAEECLVDYDVVCWNRKGEKTELPENYYVYQRPTDDSYSNFRKLMEINGYNRFVRKILRKREYQLVLTFTIAESVFWEPVLIKRYRGRFIFDIRDYSPMLNNPFLRGRIVRLLRYSGLNVISSEGFKKWLPGGFEYLVCHNTDMEKVLSGDFAFDKTHKDGCLDILTIGSIRNIQTNMMVIDAFRNKEGIHLSFVGDGNGVSALVNYCKESSIENVSFHGRYQKKDEDTFVQKCDMINIVLPSYKISEMSNRFYLSVIFRKPMIVNDGCFQAELVRKYGLGVVISNASEMYKEVLSYWESLDWEDYNKSCRRFLTDISRDMLLFRSSVAKLMAGESLERC